MSRDYYDDANDYEYAQENYDESYLEIDEDESDEEDDYENKDGYIIEGGDDEF